MTDIVERLRDKAERKSPNLYMKMRRIETEAADEIERLREENTYLQQIIKEYQRAMGFDEECSIALGEKK